MFQVPDDDKPVFLLDMDGVCANFADAAISAMTLSMTHDEIDRWNWYEDTHTEKDFLRAIGYPGFWSGLPVYSWAHQLLEELRDIGHVIFCSAPVPASNCIEEKIDWLKKHTFIDDHSRDYVFTAHKWLFAGCGAILIDDGDHNHEAFLEHGGESILFPQPWNQARQIRQDKVSYVIDSIEDILEIRSRKEPSCEKKCKTTCHPVDPVRPVDESVLEQAVRVRQERSIYGRPTDHFTRTTGQINAMLGDEYLKKPLEPHHWALFMAADKCSRAMNSPQHKDHWVDIPGYASCGADVVEDTIGELS